MEDPRLILLLLVAVGCITVPVAVARSRRRVFETWARVVSVLLCVFGLGWAGLAFSLIRLGDAASGPLGVGVRQARTLIGGVCIGLGLAILIARPYKRVTIEELQA